MDGIICFCNFYVSAKGQKKDLSMVGWFGDLKHFGCWFHGMITVHWRPGYSLFCRLRPSFLAPKTSSFKLLGISTVVGFLFLRFQWSIPTVLLQILCQVCDLGPHFTRDAAEQILPRGWEDPQLPQWFIDEKTRETHGNHLLLIKWLVLHGNLTWTSHKS